MYGSDSRNRSRVSSFISSAPTRSPLHMQAVFSFIDHHGSRRIDHRVRHDDIPTDRQAVHEYRVVGRSHFLLIDYPVFSKPRPMGYVGVRTAIEPAAAPALGVDDVDTIERLG